MKVKELADQLIMQAAAKKSSDIFILPKKGFAVYWRTSQGLSLQKELEQAEGQSLINYLKYSAQMDLSEHRRPQIGALSFERQNLHLFLRFSSLGDYLDRESLVIRLIYSRGENRYFLPEQFATFAKLASQRGLIVTSGPTGSGKTSFMYDLAAKICAKQMVMTIEDPVEIKEPAFLQAQVNLQAGISYASLLKAALRHRPDILIIGEIRDAETAQIAVNAALSGHLVLATVHAKSTLQTLDRLRGLGVSQSQLANCLTAVSYQRLLPTEEGVACLFDLAYGADLQKKGSFIAWQEQLQRLQKEGEISAETAQKFQWG
jgi:competence protein ComGA